MAERNALTRARIDALKPKETDYKVPDGGGLYLLVSTAGGKLWRLRYRRDGEQRQLAFGEYPDVSLKAVRDTRDKAQFQLAKGIDPNTVRNSARIGKEPDSFAVVAPEWFDKREPTWAPTPSPLVSSPMANSQT